MKMCANFFLIIISSICKAEVVNSIIMHLLYKYTDNVVKKKKTWNEFEIVQSFYAYRNSHQGDISM